MDVITPFQAYRQKAASTECYQLALFGRDISQSPSKSLHQGFAKAIRKNIHYRLIDVSEENFEHDFIAFFMQEGLGANITVPYKQKVIPLLDEYSPEVKLVGAVNTVKRFDDGRLVGYNTDGVGFYEDCKNKNIAFENKRIVLCGAGGAARGILPFILKENPQEIILLNRTLEKAENLAKHFNYSTVLHAEPYEHCPKNFDIIIDATSSSETPMQLPYSLNPTKDTIAYDLKYRDNANAFMYWAKSQGISNCYEGSGMLKKQALQAFNLWFA